MVKQQGHDVKMWTWCEVMVKQQGYDMKSG